jgi:hypothetical protein
MALMMQNIRNDETDHEPTQGCVDILLTSQRFHPTRLDGINENPQTAAGGLWHVFQEVHEGERSS